MSIAMLLLVALVRGYAPSGWRPAVRSGTTLRRWPSMTPVVRPAEAEPGVVDDPGVVVVDDEKAEEVLADAAAGAAASEEVADAAEDATEKDAKEEKEEDVTESVVFLERKLEGLRRDVAQLDEEILDVRKRAEVEWAEWGPHIETLKGEFESIKKRESGVRSRASTVQRANVLRKILPVTDNFEFAASYTKPETQGEQAIYDKYGELRTRLQAAFADMGVDAIDAVGVPFDPTFHEAIMSEPSADVPSQHITKVLQKGYKVEDIVIRPATVGVSL